MKALDIVKTPNGGIAIVKETIKGGTEASISYIQGCNPRSEHNSWWYEYELKVIDSIPRLLASTAAHPFGSGQEDVKLFFGTK